MPRTGSLEDPAPITRAVARAANLFWSPRPTVRWTLALLVVLGLVGVAFITYLGGGTRLSLLHLAYMPIAAAALLFGVPGGVAAGVLAGLLLGPWMPLDVANGDAQPLGGWLFRLALFTLNGVVFGGMATLLKMRLARVERLRGGISQLYARNLRLFASLVSERDELTAGHCERVAQNSAAIARELQLPEDEIRRLYWAGLLHDLGKIGVSEAILRKPGRLTTAEFTEMKRHARLGRDVLLTVSDAFESIAEGVYSHHERWDGRGYPRSLQGEQIPLFGRIICVADVFEAVTSERHYRDPMPVDEALRLIRAGSGTQFDPAVVRAFFAAYEVGHITRQENPVPLYDTLVVALASQSIDAFDLPESF